MSSQSLQGNSAVLVTGGCGFIGSNFIRYLLNSYPDSRVINLDKLTYAGNPANLQDLESSGRYEFVRGDICDLAAVHNAMGRVREVIHFAAETHVDRSIDSSNDFVVTNVLGTRTLLDAALRHKIERFVHISTDEVYGSIQSGEAKEDSILNPSSPYSAAKAASDLLALSYWMTHRLPVTVIRCTNNFGPYQFPEKVIPLFITNLLRGKKVPVYGTGQNRRDWIFVLDACRAIDLVFRQGKPGNIYNIGGGNEITNLQLTRQIIQKMGLTDDFIQPVADRPGHDFRYAVNTEKIRALGFKPAHSFEAALDETIAWYRQNGAWWEPLKCDKFTVK